MATLSPVKFFLSFSPKNLQEHVHLITFASKKKKKEWGTSQATCCVQLTLSIQLSRCLTASALKDVPLPKEMSYWSRGLFGILTFAVQIR